jgi:hypothetical protein
MSKLVIVASAFVVLTASAAAAHAEAPPSYVSVGGQLSGELNFTTGLGADAGIRVKDSPVLVHAGIAKGSFTGLEEAVGTNDDKEFIRGEGKYLKLRVGIESQSCTRRGGACAVYGVDAGFVGTNETNGPWTDTPSATYREYQLVPRGGIDFGGESLRVRVIAGLPVGVTTRTTLNMTEMREGAQGLDVSAAVAYRF